MLGKLFGKPTDRVLVLKAKHHPVANTAAVITLAAAANLGHVIHSIQWSYDVDPTGGFLRVAINGTTEWEVAITAKGPGGFSFPMPGGTNQAVVVTLGAGGGGVIGKVNAQYTSESPLSK